MVDRDEETCYKVAMPSDQKTDRVLLSGRVPRTLADRIVELARIERRTVQAQTELVVEAGLHALEQAYAKVEEHDD